MWQLFSNKTVKVTWCWFTRKYERNAHEIVIWILPSIVTTRNSSGDETENMNFLYDDIVHVIISIWSAVTDGFFIIREESRRQACDVFKTSRWASGGDFVIVWRDGRQIIWWRVVGWDDQKALHSGGSCEPRFGDRWTGGLPRPDSLSLGEVSHHVKVKTRIKWRI